MVFQVSFTQRDHHGSRRAAACCSSPWGGSSPLCMPACCAPQSGGPRCLRSATPLPGSFSPQLLKAVTLGSKSALEIRRHSLRCSLESVCTHSRCNLGLHWGAHIGRGLEGMGALGPFAIPCILSGGSWARPLRDKGHSCYTAAQRPRHYSSWGTVVAWAQVSLPWSTCGD